MTTRTAPSRPWTETWDPEDEDFWERGARHIARRNLSVAVLCGHLALCVWGMWSALVLFRSPGTGPARVPAHGLAYGPGGTFLLVASPVAAWAALRWAGSRASGRADRPDGRERVVLGTAALLPAARGTSVGFAGGFTALCVCGGAGAGALDRLVRGGDGRAGGLPRGRARRSAEDGPRAVRGGGPGVAEALGGVAVLLVFAACHAVSDGSAAPALRVLAVVHGVCAVAARAVVRRRGRVAAVAPYRPGAPPAVPVRMSSRG
ncbi:hypothetical protein [Streptomyces albireticuli]|uniref:Uncharacterized protein n=1 Tax=Streptomyces albireticuli TaxID=1940 RepID=A0A2A2CYK3_9ACTN|nr:hypothetical protein [Streptomyces albireticuli]MCD9145498.1 hypothetical protein [Streptomyces albireticuli]MCD9165213.1 hypothetical protein [Streptomyces albireticuli]MCD9195742.1 hypothetical protein [Streptomyces albireticuli]PAU44325.1 hypothetical protein CK936_35470 [Streptomyces albireticuli]